MKKSRVNETIRELCEQLRLAYDGEQLYLDTLNRLRGGPLRSPDPFQPPPGLAADLQCRLAQRLAEAAERGRLRRQAIASGPGRTTRIRCSAGETEAEVEVSQPDARRPWCLVRRAVWFGAGPQEPFGGAE